MQSSQAISIQNASLHGDWLLSDAAPKCVAMILAGSGPTDADGNQPSLRINNLRDLAYALADDGVATLRFDKRGVGRSIAAAVSEESLGIETYVEDAAHWMDWLKGQSEGLPIYLLGHSEGALIAALTAQRKTVAGVVSLCAPARRASDILRSQLVGKLPAHWSEASESILSALEQGQDGPPCPEGLEILYRSSVRPYLRSWFQYDPQIEAAKLVCPHLWVWGEADEQIPSEWQYLSRGQNYACIPDMNHAMHSISEHPSISAQLVERVRAFLS